MFDGGMVRFTHWHTEPALLGGILLCVWLYALLVGPLRRWIAPERGFPTGESLWFACGVISFYGAVGSPLDAMGESFLFSAHMLQHNILQYITALCALRALPTWLVDALLVRCPRVRAAAAVLVHPVTAGFVFTTVFVGWHFPVLYEAALHDKVIHMVEHLTMFLSSMLMLWAIRSPSRILPPIAWGSQMLYIFLLMVAQIPLFAILTFSPEVLYPTYELAPRITALDPLSDQVLGGLIMKVANMVLSLFLMGRAFVQWSREAA
jgi:putative membrane protein